MSTKIYDAYIFNGKYDEVLPLMKELKRLTIDQLKSDISCKISMNEVVLSKHFSWMKEDKRMMDLEWLDLARVLSTIFKNDSLLDLYDFKSPSCVVYMVDDRIAFQFFQLHSKVKKLIDSDPRIIDYHYQNSTDQSNYDWRNEKWDDMSSDRKDELTKEWDSREMFWDRVFHGSDTPVDSGLSYSFVPWNFTEICMELKNKSSLRDIKINHIVK